MILSSIEEQDGRMIITPFLTDNVAALKEGFFLFFESYDKNNLDKVDFVWELKNSAGKIIQQSKKVVRTLDSSTSRHYLKVGPLQNIGAGAYTLQLIALKHTDNDMFSKDDYLAIAERSIRFEQTLGGTAVPELSKAIKQLRYVTDQDTIDYILSATNEEDKQNRFMEFWYNLDPTPNSERNEAYEDFYSRVSYANSNFRSYNEGWMTDKGMVYIIYGPPMNMEKYPSNAGDNRVYERWAYSNNREFIFLDNTGFGDYRLVRPMGVSDKYEFNK
jgi:GWxTD domain-containing protein